VTFTTLTYILFLTLVFALYWSSKRRTAQNVLLLITSYLFYASWDYRFCALLLATSLIDYFVGRALGDSDSQGKRRVLLFISLGWNLGLLAFFKYSNFFIESFRDFSGRLGWHVSPPLLKIILPVGISFFTFKSLSYTLDIYRRQLKPKSGVVEYLAFVAFFPQLLAGPIDRASTLLPQFFAERKFNYEQAVDGCRQILWGFFKKMVLADNLSPLVDHFYASPQTAAGPHLVIATACFAFQIYCDFSAYSDIAIGSAKLVGFNSTRNFAYPYFAESMSEFWRRWHISLTSWFRDYVFFSLGGVRGTSFRRAINVVITFLLSGFWHGASWNFLIWGGLNGLVITPDLFKKRQKKRPREASGLIPSLGSVIRMVRTFVIACLIWIFFRAPTLVIAGSIYKRILVDLLNVRAYLRPGAVLAYSPIGYLLPLLLVLFVISEWVGRKREHPLNPDRLPRALRWAVYSMLILVTLRYGIHVSGDFVYFRF
jgi:D-alanyl-lipoteichoic acid acyltransferase DltB (MBOAT superfamily)